MTKLINFLILFYLLITSTALATSDFRTTNIDIMSTLKMFDVSGTSALSVTQQSLSGTPYSISLPGAQGAANTCMVNNGSGVLSWGASGSGVSIVTANGFAGSNSSGAITLSTTVSSGMVKSNGTALQLATAGTDYQAPISLGAFGSTPNANGLSFSSNVLNMQPASASDPGGVSTGTQSFGGSKTFVSPLIVNDAAEDGSNIEVVDPIANKTGTLGQITTNTLLVSYDGVAVVAGANGVGLYSQASPLFSGQVKATDTNTNPASVTPNQGQAVFAILNGSATANTFSTLAFGANQGDSTLVDSAVIGRHVATGSGVESGQLEFWTENAGGGLVEAAVINKTGAFRLNTYGAGCLQSDASGNITSVGGSCGGGGSGTVTSITAGTGLSGGTITTSGTIAVNASQNITTLSNLTSNGIVTTSGGTGALSVTATTGSGSVVLATSPTLVTPALGTPSALVGTNITGTGASFTAGAASALAATPSLCSTGQAPTGILANGNATGCATIGGGSFGSGSLNAKFCLEDATVPYTTIDGAHYQSTAGTLSAVNMAMFNSGSSGSTQIRVNQYRSGTLNASATASISASSSAPAGGSESLSGSLTLAIGDIITVDVVSTALGAPEGLCVEY